MKSKVKKALVHAIKLHKAGKLREAERQYRAIIEVENKNPDANHNLGVLITAAGKPHEALQYLNTALKSDAKQRRFWLSYINALMEAKQFAEATQVLKRGRSIGLTGEYVDLLEHKLGTAQAQHHPDQSDTPSQQAVYALLSSYGSGNLIETEGLARSMCQQFPSYFLGWKVLGAVFSLLGKSEDSIEALRRSIRFNPLDSESHSLIGAALRRLEKPMEAEVSCREAIRLNPDFPGAHNNLGIVLRDLQRFTEAEASFREAIRLKPDFPEALNNLGNALRDLGRIKEAQASFRKAIKLKPDFPEAHHNLGTALHQDGKLDEAIAAYKCALEMEPNTYAEAQMLHLMRNICDWSNDAQLDQACARLSTSTSAVVPFAMLAIEDNPGRQLARAKAWAAKHYGKSPLPLPDKPKTRPERLRVGYFSANFHDHAVLYLMAGLLRNHDHELFEIFAYSYGHVKSGKWRENASGDVDHFFDVSEQTDRAIVDLARSHSLDIAIDLMGHTQGSRSGLFQFRLAPVQINYLGYPGTMGADFIDYIIADREIIPEQYEQFYKERKIYLPHTYLPNDDHNIILPSNMTRAELGLPNEAFVFCCFNQMYKISSREFDIWMRILSQIEQGILWLMGSNGWAEQNLRREAESRGISASRIVFGGGLSYSEHQARYRHADLFVDTFNYNAHTTAVDALWAGLPVVTKQGKQFAARVAASLLNAVGLPELITTTEAEYENLIVDLAKSPDTISEIKKTLATNLLREPLFDTTKYTRDFERGLRCAYDVYFDGKKAIDIFVTQET